MLRNHRRFLESNRAAAVDPVEWRRAPLAVVALRHQSAELRVAGLKTVVAAAASVVAAETAAAAAVSGLDLGPGLARCFVPALVSAFVPYSVPAPRSACCRTAADCSCSSSAFWSRTRCHRD